MSAQARQTAIRLTEIDEQILAALSTKKGVNKTSIIKIALREMAEREGIHVDPRQQPEVKLQHESSSNL